MIVYLKKYGSESGEAPNLETRHNNLGIRAAARSVRNYVWEGSKVIASTATPLRESEGTRFYHSDRLSNRMITDGNGVVKGTMDNLPFGEYSGLVGEVEKHRFTSYECNSGSGSDYAINR